MDIGSIFLILALLIPIVIFVIRPIIEHSLVPAAQPGQDLSSLLAERDHLVASIRELDDDYHLGKIQAEEYPPQRLTLLQSGAEILQKIDVLQVVSDPSAAEDRLEAAILAHRQIAEPIHPQKKNGNAVPPVPDDDIEQKIASRRRSMQGKVGGFCPKCGRPVQVSDRFCPHCGATLS